MTFIMFQNTHSHSFISSSITITKHTLITHTDEFTMNEKGNEMRESEENEMIDGLRDVCVRIQTHTHSLIMID